MHNGLRRVISLGVTAVALVACGGDDITFGPDAGGPGGGDGGSRKDGTVDAHVSDVKKDVARDAGSDTDGGPVPQRVLVTQSAGSGMSELVAVNVADKVVDGRLPFASGFGTTDTQSGLYPFLLEQATSAVARLDPVRPWLIDSTWDVLLTDGFDGGYPYTDPTAVVVSTGSKAYVLRYNRNDIAVIDPKASAEAGKPASTIDLSGLLQKGGDGTVEMTSGLYEPMTKRVYVVLENIDQSAVVESGGYYYLLCTGTVSTVTAIDTTTDTIVNLGGKGPMGSIALKGFDPVMNGLAYDPVNNRILLAEAGCNEPADGGVGPVVQRGVEAVNLTDGSTSILLNASKDFKPGHGYPTGIVYIDETDGVLGFDQSGREVFNWNPKVPKLGTKIPNAPDRFTWDGAGNLLGTVTTYGDAGATTKVVSVAIGTGTQTVLAVDPCDIPGEYISGVDVWPHP